MRSTAHSTRNHDERVMQAWRWLQTALDDGPLPALLIVLGLGDGSLLDALDARAPATRVLALEPDPAQARAFLAQRKWNAWRTAGRLVYLADPGYAGADEAWRIFKHKDEPKIVVHAGTLRAPGHARATEVLKKILGGVKANAQARKRFAPRYVTNVLRNIPAIVSGHDVRSLTNAYRGMPAVIAAAGPSLDTALPTLHDAARRTLMIACDTALRPLLHSGLHPQLVVGADPSTINARHFQSLPDCSKTWLVAESALDPSALAPFHGRTLWFRLATHHPWPWLNTLGLDVGLVDMWGSVLTAAFQVACLAGCDPIVIVGADLSHTGGHPYARTTTYELDWATAVARGETPEETWRGHIAGNRPIERPDLRGVTTTTTPTMLAFKDWLVARAKRSGRRVINATGAGMLFGDGIEQGAIGAALNYTGEIPPVAPGIRTERAADVSISNQLQIVRNAVVENGSATPLADWIEFADGGLDHTVIGVALDDAISALESPPRPVVRASAISFERLFSCEPAAAIFRKMPESLERLKIGLSGAAPPANEANRVKLLMHALDVLADISEHVAECDDLASGAAATRVGRSPATALYPWPESSRWAVATFEALLGQAWQNAVPASLSCEPAEAQLPCVQHAGAPCRPHVTQACRALALEWLRCAASIDAVSDRELIAAARRLSSATTPVS
jgi:hypothetical protein